jgi:hypothetical protein
LKGSSQWDEGPEVRFEDLEGIKDARDDTITSMLFSKSSRLLLRLFESALRVVAITEAAEEEDFLGVVKSHLQGTFKHLAVTLIS